MGACSVMSGEIVDSRGISGPALGALINSFLFVGSGGGGGCDDMHCRYGATICTTDMHHRYARPENRKGQEHVAPGP